MKLSQAVTELQSLIAKSGDLDLKIYDEFGRLVNPTGVKLIEQTPTPTAARFTSAPVK